MGDVVLRAERLGKCYHIGRQGPPATSLREALGQGIHEFGRRLRARLAGRRLPPAGQEEFWALRDVSFEVARGEVLGVIGRNGAGKSTLLKVLSRITEPTTGRVGLRGHVTSLLEVGTGFHPELTGRENVYLNGAILGMSRPEIRRKFDEIVAFAGVEQFLDTPVKRYSSGMYVRLAFAVAAHLEPDILIIDEVLAVGDIAFQRKCLGKMDEVARGGRTVLFVSHSMQAVQHLCSRVLLLEQSRVLASGPVAGVIRRYHELLREGGLGAQTAVGDERLRRGSGAARLDGVRITDEAGEARLDFRTGETIRFVLPYRVFQPVPKMYASVMLRSGRHGEIVTSAMHPVSAGPLPAGSEGSVTLEWPAVNLRPGEYPLFLWLGDDGATSYDTVDGLIGPLQISADGSVEELGYDPSSEAGCGYFDVASRVIASAGAGPGPANPEKVQARS